MNAARYRRLLFGTTVLLAACSSRDPGPSAAGDAGVVDLAPGQTPPPASADVFAVAVPPPGALAALRPIAVPATVSGALAPGDNAVGDGRVCDEYLVQLTAGVHVWIAAHGGASSVAGSTLDMYLFLSLQGATVASDDDSGGNFDSRIEYTPSVTGAYVIRVTTFSSSNPTGNYTLETGLNAPPVRY